METAVSAPSLKPRPVTGDPMVFGPPFPLLDLPVVRWCGRAVRRRRGPTQLHGPVHVLPGGGADVHCFEPGVERVSALLMRPVCRTARLRRWRSLMSTRGT